MTRTPSPQTTEGLGATPLTAEAKRLHAEWGHLNVTIAERCEAAGGFLYADEPDPCRFYVGLATLDAARLSVPSEALAEDVFDRFSTAIGLAVLAGMPPTSRVEDVRISVADAQAIIGVLRLAALPNREDAPDEPRKLCPHCDGRGTVGAEDTDPAILAAAPRYDGHEFYEDARLPREPGLCDYTMPDGDWCGRPLSFHWHNREAAQRERLREAIGTTDEDSGLEHWHYARGGRTSPDERAGVFVDRQQVLDAIDRVLG